MPVVTKDEPQPVRRRGGYRRQFRRDVCALVLDQRRSVADVCQEVGLVEQTAYN